jgi:TetR/AcrR family tetracycline transcriptional repressor
MARPAKQSSTADDKEMPALSRERIVDVALEMISEKGLDGFSLRDVARSLGVYPTAIYWHIKNKNALLGEVCTLTISKVVPPRGKGAWQDWLRALFRQYRKTMKDHPNLAQLVGARLLSNSDRNTDLIERILLVLEEAGCPEANMVEFYNTVVASMCGFATMEFAPLPAEDLGGWRSELEERVHRVSAIRFPKLAKHLPALANNSFILRWQSGHERPMDASFETYLDVFVYGLEGKIAVLKASAGRRPARSPSAVPQRR